MNAETKYVTSVIKDFDVVYQNTLKEMFDELIENGWTTDVKIYCKEKYGVFICEINSNQKLQNIADTYVGIINSICPNCGEKEKPLFEDDTSSEWIDYTCFDCWSVRTEKYFTISNISKSGFNCLQINDNVTERKDFNWSKDVKRIKLTNKSSAYFDKEIDVELEIELLNNKFLFFNKSYIHFYKLLKNVPRIYFIEEDDVSCVEYIFSNISDCPICKKIALYKNKCLVCHTNLELLLKWPSTRHDSWKWYNKVDEIIVNKRETFSKLIDNDLILKYRLHRDESFEKSSAFI
ncbi:hypothetical protein EZY14_009550 [Kordia sp. TARA_039_SRF]|nr:hypothetical protein EZY14_009550 [Kordia sp. TARA_039_SRF]